MSTAMKIVIHNPNNLPVIDYRKLVEFQGNLKDLDKTNYNRARKSIKENGFFVPFFVWESDGELKLLDGHQRLRVLKLESCEPFEVPYLQIPAANEKEAKQKLLIISSQYGKIKQEGFDEFTFDLDDQWKFETLNFDALFHEFNAAKKDYIAGGSDDVEQEEDEEKEKGHRVPSASDNEYSNFDLLMYHKNKLLLIEILNDVKKNYNIEKTEDALLHIIKFYQSKNEFSLNKQKDES